MITYVICYTINNSLQYLYLHGPMLCHVLNKGLDSQTVLSHQVAVGKSDCLELFH